MLDYRTFQKKKSFGHLKNCNSKKLIKELFNNKLCGKCKQIVNLLKNMNNLKNPNHLANLFSFKIYFD